jgi:hypothetical protein
VSAGQIHDLGYKRYVGSRRSVRTRWTVIMRHQISVAWKGWWRFKVWLICSILVTVVTSVLLYTLQGRFFRRLGGMSGVLTRYIDGILPDSAQWYCKVGFIVSLTIAAEVLARDVQSGAFIVYFSRSVRPRDYVIGKLAGLGVLLAVIMLAGPLVLAGVRLGLSENLDQLLELLPLIYKVLAIGALGTLIYGVIPLGFSALIPNPRYAIGLWAAYYLVIGWMALGIGFFTSPNAAALDLATALYAVSVHLFDLRMTGRHAEPSTIAALISILGHAAIAIGLVVWRVRSAQHAGVGTSS